MISQIGLDELFDEEVIAGNRSYAEAIISAELASKEDILSLVAEYLGYELQIGEIGEIDPKLSLPLRLKLQNSMELFRFIFQRMEFTFCLLIHLIRQLLMI